jgi:adenylylsulfate kinase
MTHDSYTVWHNSSITKEDRHELNQHKSCVVWFTGLSGSGKSTLANAVETRLYNLGKRSYVLDGDNIRMGLNKGLGFSKDDRKENIRRIGEVAKLFVDSGQIVLTAFISPYKEDRDNVRNQLEASEFFEIYVKCPIKICENRDPKGLYKKARSGEITNFTGINSPYEEPENPDLVIETNQHTIEESANLVIDLLKEKNII